MGDIPRFDVWKWDEDLLPAEEVFGAARPVPGVYFVQAGDGYDGPVKIGWAMDVGRRFEVLQAGNQEELYIRLICQTEMCLPTDLRVLEGWLHRAFETYRLRGEWFESAEPVVAFMTYPQSCLALLRGYEGLSHGVKSMSAEQAASLGYLNQVGTHVAWDHERRQWVEVSPR